MKKYSQNKKTKKKKFKNFKKTMKDSTPFFKAKTLSILKTLKNHFLKEANLAKL